MTGVQEGSSVERETGTFRVKAGLAEMLKGGVIMDVTTADQAKIAAWPTRPRSKRSSRP
jgi:pyridoxal 5'-phosphate synthase pdxS subunit